PVIESVRDSDFVLLVTEPTPFGLNDLKLAVEMVRALTLPFAVMINRADVGNGDTRAYCSRQRIEVLAEMPDDRQVAEAYSRGEMACDAIPKYRDLYNDLLNSLAKRVPAYAG
ncbi:MAG: (4Fe-4S)-binding protein, partial [bacterium]